MDTKSYALLKDLVAAVRSRRRMKDTLFFQAVRGGNKYAVATVIDVVRRAQYADLRNWIFCCKSRDPQHVRTRPGQHVVVFTLTCLSCLVVLPLFYSFHRLVRILMEHSGKRISQDPDLTLYYAVVSEREEIVRLFLDAGLNVTDVDDSSNNVYHYLADLAVDDYAKAIRCHRILASCCPESGLRDAIVYAENSVGLTPLETCLKYSCVKLFDILSRHDGVMSLAVTSIGPEVLEMHMAHEPVSGRSGNGFCPEAASPERDYDLLLHYEDTTAREHLNLSGGSEGAGSKDHDSVLFEEREFDIGMYTQGKVFGKQSYLLQLVAGLDMEKMPEDDVTSCFRSAFLRTWMEIKVKRYMWCVLLYHGIQTLLTVILLVNMVKFGQTLSPYPLLVPMLEKYQDQVLQHSVAEFHAQLGHTSVCTHQAQSIQSAVGNLSRLQTHPCHRTMVAVGAIQMDQCAAGALQTLNQTCFYGNASLEQLLEATGMQIIFRNRLPTSHVINIVLQAVMASHGVLMIGTIYLFLWRNFRFGQRTAISCLRPFLERKLPGSYIDRQVILLMYGFFFGYSYILRQMERAFAEECGTYIDLSLSRMNAIAMEIRVNFSATAVAAAADASQAEITWNSSLLKTAAMQNPSSDTVRLTRSYSQAISLLLMGCIVLRLVLLLHSLRMLPRIGFFIITLRKLGRHLLDFAVVYVLVACLFALAFYFLMSDTTCPIDATYGFQNILNGLFSTYEIALGYGDYEFKVNGKVQVTFVAYTVVTVLLLFNIIIAVMSARADRLYQQPWKNALWRLEQWDEILGKEALVETMREMFWSLANATGFGRNSRSWTERETAKLRIQYFE